MSDSDNTRQYLNTFVKTSIFVFFTIILSKLFTYAYKIIIARQFGPSIYGSFSLAIIVLGFFTALASLGLPDGVLRYISYYLGKKDNPRIKYFTSFSLRCMILSGLVIGFLLFFLADFIALNFFNDPQLASFLRAFSIIIPLSILGSLYISFLRAYQSAKTSSFLQGIFHNGIRLLLICLLLFVGLGLPSLVYSYILSYVALTLAASYFAHKKTSLLRNSPQLNQRERKKLSKELFSYSWPLLFVGLLLSLFYWTDSLILGYFTNAETVGFYNAAITLTGLYIMASDLFSQLFLPIVSRELSRNNKKTIAAITKQISKWIYLINLPLLGALIIFPEVLLSLFFGAEFAVAATPLRILAVGGLFSGFLNIFTHLLSAKRKTRWILYNFLTFALVNLILNIALIRYGMTGVAIATTISWIGFWITLILEIKKSYGFYPIKRTLIKITFVAIPSAAIMIFLATLQGQTLTVLLTSGLSAGIVYIGLLFLTKTLDEHDWGIIQDIRVKLKHMRSYSAHSRETPGQP